MDPSEVGPTSESNEGDGDRFSFGRIISMIMMQQHMDNKQRERQYKHESEQREQDYQLCQEEMEIVCKDACLQRQMKKVIFM